MHTRKKYLILAVCLWVYAFAIGQNPELDLQKVLEKLDRGESVEHMQINLGDINFAIGTATLEQGAKSYLDKVAKLLQSAPNMGLLIKGHADNTGSAAVNEKLSTDRANAVRNHLLAQNIAAERLEAKGFGSSMPVADNQTPLGRAKNRRVELEILKRTEAAALQDVVVLRNGVRIGAIVRTFDTSRIYYRQFGNIAEQQITVGQVEKILFADGRVVHFDAPVATRQAPSPKPARRGYSFDPFGESEAFHRGQFVLGLGAGIGNNVGIRTNDNTLMLPPVWLTLELPIGHNLGVGLSAGAMMWSPKNDDAARLSYFSLAPRVAYHLNLGSSIDLYGGVAVTGRLVTLEAERQGSPVSVSKNNVDAAAFGGIRYYFSRFFGLCGEFGNDNVSCVRLGLSLRFGG
jgi:outer membrane protein OmpA-like peptidoglycan-associated protein